MDHLPTTHRCAPLRWLLLGIAVVFLVLGVVGIFIPVLPTVPFLIVAAWAAARSSPRLHHWLYAHPRFGRLLREWNEAGLVPRRAKWFATVMMAGSALWMVVALSDRRPLLVTAVVAVMGAVLLWLWRRPEQRRGA